MRYFDSEDNKGLKLSPKIVVGAAIVFTILSHNSYFRISVIPFVPGTDKYIAI